MNLEKVYQHFIRFSMLEQGLRSEEAVLEDETGGTLRESLTVWSQPANREVLKRYAKYAKGFSLAPLNQQTERVLPSLKEVFSAEEEMKRRGRSGNFKQFLKLAGIKGLSMAEMIQHEDVFTNTVMPRKYPYPFHDLQEFQHFVGKLKLLVQEIGIRCSDIRIQGSSLRKLQPKDLDIGIIVPTQEYNRIVEIVRPKVQNRGGVTTTFEQYTRSRTLGIFFLGMINPRKPDVKASLKACLGDLGIDPQVTIIEAGSRLDSKLFLSVGPA
jgi:hypothetical protein